METAGKGTKSRNFACVLVRQTRIHKSHLRALLLCYVTLAKGGPNQDVTTRLEEDEFDLAAQHNFAQWQCVMHEALNVNFVLQEPLPTPRIWSLYDGLLVQRLLRGPGRAAQANEVAGELEGCSRLSPWT